MKINTINYFITDAFRSLKRNKTISIASVITMFITFVVLGTFSLIAQNAKVAISGVEDKIEIQVFLLDDISLDDQKEVQITLEEQDGVKDVTYQSKEDAYNSLLETTEDTESLLQGYTSDKNPFPASFVVKIEDASQIDDIISSVQDMNGVEEVRNQQDLVSTITGVVKGVRYVGTVLFVILVAVSVFLIMNTTKLTVYSRRREVGIMKFVGATDWFIRWPFIIEGVVIGFLGSLLSILFMVALYKWVVGLVVSNALFAQVVSTSYIYTSMLWKFVLGGILIGGFSSYAALRKFLKV